MIRISPIPITRILLGIAIITCLIVLLAAKKPWTFQEVDKIHDFAIYWSWWAAAVNLLPLSVLFVTASRWMSPLPAIPEIRRTVMPRGAGWAIAAAMLVFAILAGMRLTTSLWDDEEYAVRRAILGTYRVKDNGSVKLKELPWSHTFWYYTKPTNHIFQSVLARLSHSTWRAIAKPRGLQLNEAAVRFPSYLCGILAVGTVGLLLARAGFAWEGAVAAWILALHPWFLRLAPEARGYGMVFFFIPLACLMAVRILESGHWRWWLGLAAAEFALLYTWPPALMILLVLNACLILRVLTEDRLRAARGVFIGRWLVSGTVAAVVFFQLFLPCVPQFREYIKHGNEFSALGYWLKNVGSLMFTGSHWSKTGSLFPPYPETWPHAASNPALYGVAVGLAIILLAFGAWRLWRKGTFGRALVAVFLLPGPIMFGSAALKNTFLYEWYVAFMLPGLAALAGMGILGLVAPWKSYRWPSWTVAGAALVVFFIITTHSRQFLLNRQAQPMRESVLLTRPSLDPGDERNLSIITVSSLASPEIYDPLVRRAASLESYRKLMEEADERGVPLFANNGFPLALRAKHPEVSAMLDDPNLFEPVAHLYAIEEMLDRRIARYKPGSVGKADWDAYRKAPAAEMPASVPFYY
jgi:hypothetical protein